METYKLGNKINCIIRAYSTGSIGSTLIEYVNQPYSILKDVGATINFTDSNKNSSQGVRNLLAYNVSEIDSLNISNVLLTDKILNLLFNMLKGLWTPLTPETCLRHLLTPWPWVACQLRSQTFYQEGTLILTKGVPRGRMKKYMPKCQFLGDNVLRIMT